MNYKIKIEEIDSDFKEHGTIIDLIEKEAESMPKKEEKESNEE